MATLSFFNFQTNRSIDMRNLVYTHLPVSQVADGLYSSEMLIFGFPERIFSGSFTFDYNSGDVVEVHGTVTSYSYENGTIDDAMSYTRTEYLYIGGFALDVSQFRALTYEQISQLIFAGNDSISGDSGVDTLLGFAGDDVITGGEGADVLYGGNGSDTANYSTATSGLHASLANPAINTGDAKGDEYHDIENLSGTDYADALNGDNAANVISGDDGSDILKGYGGGDDLRGGTGNDILIGGAGADSLSGGLGSDTASYLGATAGVYASLANASINTKDAKGDTYQSVENLTGSGYADRLNGSTLDNVIDGGAGEDIIKGYAGNDTLIGGAGGDIFVFNAALDEDNNVDVIVDFSPAEDIIQLEDAIFTQIGPVGTLASGAFRANASGTAQTATDRIIYETDTGKLFYDADGFFSGAAIHFAKLSPNLPLQNVDFVVI
jgi:serralysin